MTTHQLIEIVEKLEDWREERHLSIESQQAGIVPNLLEELTEYIRATSDNERIDAMCDIIVFSINSFVFDTNRIKEIDKILGDSDFFATSKNSVYKSNDKQIQRIMQDIKELHYDTIVENIGVDTAVLSGIISSALSIITRLGYDPYLAMQETIKEISSRTGSYDENIGKWVKNTSDEAKQKWYNANYDICKTGGNDE